MIFGGIVAGGIGTRMENDIPKQFLDLGGKPIVIRTLEKFLMCDKFDCVCVGINKDWKEYAEKTIKKFGITDERIMTIEGGKTRNHTIMKIIIALENDFGVFSENIIVTHDAVRPFVKLKTIEENINIALKYGICNTVVEFTDTVVRSFKGESIAAEIPDRTTMFLGQTPQTFSMKEFKSLYCRLNEQEKNVLTDACKMFLNDGRPVRLVRGGFSNMKITNLIDYKLAQILVNSESLL